MNTPHHSKHRSRLMFFNVLKSFHDDVLNQNAPRDFLNLRHDDIANLGEAPKCTATRSCLRSGNHVNVKRKHV